MRSRILKRPMFRMGGSTDNVGIMDGMRQRYAESDPKGVQPKRSVLATPGLSPFLIDFGLNLLSATPRGNIFATAASAAQDPFRRFQERQIAAQQIASDRAFKEKLLDKQLAVEKEIAGIKRGDKERDALRKFYAPNYDNFALVEARVDYDLDTQKTLASAYGAENVGEPLDFDVNNISQRKNFIKANKNNVGKYFYSLLDKRTYKLVDTAKGTDLVPLGSLDTEGENQPSEGDLGFEQSPYQKEIAEKTKEALERKKEEQRKKVLESLPSNAFDEGF
tara:strand:+ start:81 stop:914 length:834 start_codon:yes stop_codon:yes gene_type:complete